MITILLIDDDERHSMLLRDFLKRFDINLLCAHDANSGLALFEAQQPQLLLLDVMLPGRDGFHICREIRKTSNVPIIMLTARGDVIDRVSGLELGADDYVGKPFEPRELVARIQTVLRRVDRNACAETDFLYFEGMEIDVTLRAVKVDGEDVELTSMEFELLSVLANNAGRKMSRDDILTALRGIDAKILTRAVDIMVSRIRGKLHDSSKPPRFIQTIWGYGYAFIARPISK